jgi:hypothetical protein
VKRLGIALAACLIACNGSSERQDVAFAHLRFEVPGGWNHADTSRRNVATTVWTPEENGRKESITVIRTEEVPAMAHAGEATVGQYLANAVAGLPDARVVQPRMVHTKLGLSGVSTDVDFIPPGLHERYHRVHVVLVDGDSLVHVIYTARSADPSLDALSGVLATIREGEG